MEREEADSLYHRVAETNPLSALLLTPALCEERVWPGAHVQIWVLVIGLLPTVAEVKLLCAFLLFSQSDCRIQCFCKAMFHYCSQMCSELHFMCLIPCYFYSM